MSEFEEMLARLYEDPEPILCPDCGGTGLHPYLNRSCRRCGGTGQLGPDISQDMPDNDED